MSIPVRKSLCVDALVASVYRQFQKIPDPRKLPQTAPISFTDVLMSGLAVFGLKFPYLLKYDISILASREAVFRSVRSSSFCSLEFF